MSRSFVPYPFEAREYAARVPATASGIEHVPTAVIVGAGPVGLAVALGLANQGVGCVVLEADSTVCIGSRAICISRRSLEIIDQLDALPAFLSKGLPWTGGRSFYRDTPVLHFTMPHDEAQRLPPMINIQQYYIEQFLLDACEARADFIDIRWQSRVTDIEHGPDGVRLKVSTPAGEYRLHTPWLVGCDGARSVVREAAGLKLRGTSYEGRYVIADVLCPTTRPVERLAWFDPPSNPGSTILMHRQPDDIWRIDYQLRDDEDPDVAARPENVIPRIEAHLNMIGERADWSPIWISLYRANALTADRYVQGRCLLAGDAAHLVPIFGVRGANSGFEDAHGLAWRLAWVIKGLAAPSLLEDYSRERVQAAHDNLRAGMKSTEFMSPPTFAYELMRTAVLSLARKHEWVRPLINPRQTQAAAYAQDASRLPAQERKFTAGPAPGTALAEGTLLIGGAKDRERLADATLIAGETTGRRLQGGSTPPTGRAGRQPLADSMALVGEAAGLRPGHLSELLSPRFTLLLFCDAPPPPALMELAGAMDEAGIPWRLVPVFSRAYDFDGVHGVDERGKLARAYGAVALSAYLVRPDGHVLARWRCADAAEIRSMIRRELQHE